MEQKQKSGGGGGGGGRGRHRDYDNSNSYGQSSNNHSAAMAMGSGPGQGAGNAGGVADGGPDPYAQCKFSPRSRIYYQRHEAHAVLDGGYANYMALWYQSLASQQAQAQGAPPS
jgi:far upstream element-binding protein